MRLVETAQREAKQRIVLCDLNWTRLVHFRLALAQFFDHPASHHHFDEIESGSVVFGHGYRSTALLFVGWLAAQLGWEMSQALTSQRIDLKNRAGKTLHINLQEKEGPAITSFMAHSGALDFCVKMAACGDLLEVCRGARGEDHTHQLLPSGENDTVKLVTEELM